MKQRAVISGNSINGRYHYMSHDGVTVTETITNYRDSVEHGLRRCKLTDFSGGPSRYHTVRVKRGKVVEAAWITREDWESAHNCERIFLISHRLST